MNIYANWFARMALIYLALGVVMGVVIGMSATHLAGGLGSDGLLHAVFVGFALMTGAGLLIMGYNLFFVLLAPREGT